MRRSGVVVTMVVNTLNLSHQLGALCVKDLLRAVHINSGLSLSPRSGCGVVVIVGVRRWNGFGDLLSLGPST